MDKEKEQQLQTTYQTFLEMGLNSPENLDLLDEIVASDIMGFGTTIDERMFSLADLKSLLIRQREQSANLQIKWSVQPVFRKILSGDYCALFVDDIDLVVQVNDQSVTMRLRYSLVLEYKNNKWIVIHFHGSKPENITTEEDTFGIEKWKKKNIELEKLVNERTAALENSLVSLKATQSQLIQSEKMASLGELTAGIAHEIQNPLNFINNFSEINNELIDELKEQLATGNGQEAMSIADNIKENENKINHHGKRADSIVKNMLQHSRKNSGEKEPTDINSLAEEYLRLSYHGLRAKDKSFNVNMETSFDQSAGQINVVSQEISRVLLNLFNNSFYSVNEKMKDQSFKGEDFKPTVWLTTKRISSPSGAGGLEIEVRDNGMGIPQKLIDKIYQPFFTTKPTGEGTGLGLSMSYDIIKKGHNGELQVTSIEGEFASFKIILPL